MFLIAQIDTILVFLPTPRPAFSDPKNQIQGGCLLKDLSELGGKRLLDR